MTDTFDDLDLSEPLLRGIAKAGWEQPTPVQRAVVPLALDGLDLLVSAATGSGKSGAFLLPMLERLAARPAPRSGTRALVLVPTRELARQVRDHFLAVGSLTRLTVAVIIGGESRGHQVAALRRNPDLLVATPGRLLEHLGTGEADLSDLEVLVLDEADRMLDMGFAEDVLAIIGASNAARQSLLFSATLDHRGLRPITDLLLRDPRVVTVDSARTPHPDITHQVMLSDGPEHKAAQLLWLLRNEAAGHTKGQAQGQALVFVNTREQATALGNLLVGEQVRTATLHGELDQRERKRVMGLFQRGDVAVLVATDVAARGLDLPGVGLVINAEVPRNGEDYLHRSGRTGRAGEHGIAISLVSASEWNRMESIARYLGLAIEQRAIDGLVARFSGPGKGRKPRPQAKAAAKARDKGAEASAADGPRQKDRHRDRKNIGKRRAPSGSTDPGSAGLTPPKRRPPPAR